MDLDEKPRFIVISGISAGIGRGMFLEFLRLGHIVAGFSRDTHKENEPSKLDKLKEEIKSIKNLNSSFTSNIDILIKKLDVTNEKGVVEWGKLIMSKIGTPPNLVIHNAGIGANVFSNVENIDIKTYFNTINVNVVGFIILAKAFTEKMKSTDNHKGIFVGMSSYNGQKGDPEIGSYVSSKFGLEGLVKCFHKELSELRQFGMCKGLGCLCVSPGMVKTDLVTGFESNMEVKDENDKNVPVFPTTEVWAKESCPWMLKLNSSHSGKSLGPPIEKETMTKYIKALTLSNTPVGGIKEYIHPNE